jgi:Zn-dependent protease with chaperone function
MNRHETSLAAIPLILAFIIACFAIAVLSLLTLGFAGVVLGVALLMAAFIAFQYLLWGWWLSDLIRKRQQKEDQK